MLSDNVTIDATSDFLSQFRFTLQIVAKYKTPNKGLANKTEPLLYSYEEINFSATVLESIEPYQIPISCVSSNWNCPSKSYFIITNLLQMRFNSIIVINGLITLPLRGTNDLFTVYLKVGFRRQSSFNRKPSLKSSRSRCIKQHQGA